VFKEKLKRFLLAIALLSIGCVQSPQPDKMSANELEGLIDSLQSRINELENIKLEKLGEVAADEVETPQEEKSEISAFTDKELDEVDPYASDEDLLKLVATDSTIIFRGLVKKPASHSSVKLTLSKPYEPDYIRTFSVAKNGIFSDEIVLKESGLYTFSAGKKKYEIFLEPSSVFGIIIDPSSENEIRFVGDNALGNSYLVEQKEKFKGWEDVKDSDWKKDASEFLSMLETKKNTVDDSFSEFLAENGESLSDEFVELVNANTFYKYARQLLKFNKKHEAWTGEEEFEKMDRDYLQQVSLNSKNLFFLYDYRKFIFEYYDSVTDEQVEKTYGTDMKTDLRLAEKYAYKFKQISKLYSDKTIRDFLKTDVTYEALGRVKDISINSLVKRFRREVKNEDYLRLVDNRYKKTIPVMNGTLAPEIVGYDLSGDEMKLSDFRGKYVYIFVWASWCAPCKVELPHYERLVDEYGRRNIEFLGVSVDEETSRWRNSFNYNNYPGSQMLVRGNWNSPMITNYKLKSVPQFILIDPQGEILTLEAPKPSANVRGTLASYGI